MLLIDTTIADEAAVVRDQAFRLAPAQLAELREIFAQAKTLNFNCNLAPLANAVSDDEPAEWVHLIAYRHFHFGPGFPIQSALVVPIKLFRDVYAVFLRGARGELLPLRVTGFTSTAEGVLDLAEATVAQGGARVDFLAANCAKRRFASVAPLWDSLLFSELCGAWGLAEARYPVEAMAANRVNDLIRTLCPTAQIVNPESHLRLQDVHHRAMKRFFSPFAGEYRAELNLAAPRCWRTAALYNQWLAMSSGQRTDDMQAVAAYPALRKLYPVWRDPDLGVFQSIKDGQRKRPGSLIPTSAYGDKPDEVGPCFEWQRAQDVANRRAAIEAEASRFQPVLEAVAKRKRLAPVLADCLNVGEGTLRALRAISPTPQSTTSLVEAAEAIDLLPGDLQAPAVREYSRFSRAVGQINLRGMFGIIDDVPSGWPAVERRVLAAWLPQIAAQGARRGWGAVCEEIKMDVADAIHSSLKALSPTELHQAPLSDAVIDVLVSLPYSRWQRFSADWHREYPKLAVELRVLGVRDKKPPRRHAIWPYLFRKPRVFGDRQSVPILDLDSLMDEGAEMNHCVFSYAEKAMRGESFIFSMRDLAGNCCSTIELAIVQPRPIGESSELPRIRVVQHRASSNRPADPECRAAARGMLDYLNQGVLDMPIPRFWRRLARCGKRFSGEDEQLPRALITEAVLEKIGSRSINADTFRLGRQFAEHDQCA